MSLNSAATPDGGEIGRAQALQSRSLSRHACVEMNPSSLTVDGHRRASDFIGENMGTSHRVGLSHPARRAAFFPMCSTPTNGCPRSHDLMLLEGAGSPAEINLREHDIVNMAHGHAADAACVLVGDIDRGGVFASLLGTMELLEPKIARASAAL